MKKLLAHAALAVLATASLPALAVDCNETTWTALAASDCRGSFSGNINGSAGELTYLASQWGSTWSFLGKSDDAGTFGPFTGNPTVGTNGTLTFDTPITGTFVIALKSSNDYSYYLFNALSPVSSLTFDDTLGVTAGAGPQVNPKALSHANLYVAAAPIPEPETYALMLAGLGVLGFVSRRRRQG
ncbi:PEP-CTERM sorting domain-containing protein [Aquabacterium sp. J223]|uniref:PEP-CTERM sorting domain-containing protein n=1 Tax=Aquabacterium sp. J223 TaxID=2898431 RepID=UPI0021AD7CC7|nr:PEP-CTERM sorting domain-containing protein [Aquabacterium sp. J223]UUX96330.1 PEP-CTERM sorting domain-containing protein [Aquabacterium sp. J223]